MSFVYVGVLWLNHHALFRRIRRVDATLNWINLFILGTSALLPFSTGVLAGAFNEQAPTSNREAAVVLYAFVAFLASTAWVPVFPHLEPTSGTARAPGRRTSCFDAQRSRPLVGHGELRLQQACSAGS